MNIKEIITFYVNDASDTLEVSFRLENDAEDEFREDFIELSEVEKCMIAMVDDFQLNRMREWYKQEEKDEQRNI